MILITGGFLVLMSVFSCAACEWHGDGTSELVKPIWEKQHVFIQDINFPRINQNKPCSDLDTLFNECKKKQQGGTHD
ncbi:TPA: hypothetical protein JFQ45_002818 [Legionella pneumophila]|jgi:hypothetical protein|nr:hypothetical protein [Legionella pneumophila]HAU9905861.1 hypothetical protein [Legionella pneumophila]HAU9927307.1 hypothetical protein [Legionella pneumophila]HAU9930240.1 hypothetical protein [Legionella pneumophila]HAU9933910.1 hypothetical protein [Legionella pneumophila]